MSGPVVLITQCIVEAEVVQTVMGVVVQPSSALMVFIKSATQWIVDKCRLPISSFVSNDLLHVSTETGVPHAKPSYKKENGTHAYAGSSSSASGMAGNTVYRRPQALHRSFLLKIDIGDLCPFY